MPVFSGANVGVGSVAGVIRTVLGLDADPDPGAGPDDIAGWDSLGPLRVLIAIEAEFGILLGDSTLAEARSVRELDDLVDAARQRASSVDAVGSDAGNRPW